VNLGKRETAESVETRDSIIKKRTKKYWREHASIEPADFSYFRTLSAKGRDFITAYEKVQDHLREVYPEDLQERPLPPEEVTFRIIGKPRRAPNGMLMLPVRVIQDETP